MLSSLVFGAAQLFPETIKLLKRHHTLKIPLALTAKKLGVVPEYCVAIEDTSLRVKSAKKAGLKCITIPIASSKNHCFSKADFVLESSKEIEKKLDFN